ncbi:MAG: DUF2892 domain-containing protein [FCB group bacterium]|nr:DUF2892 domain-containing protein [FCB group bacterium]
MEKNVGKSDKTFRYILGIVVLIIGFYLKSWWGLVGLLPIITASIGWCPAYLPFGIKTCATEKK